MITKAVPPREIRILPRGNWMDKSGKVVQPHTPHFLKQLDTGGRRADSARPGEVARVARQPADGARRRESAVEAVLRHRPVEGADRHGLARRGAAEPGAARLAGDRVHGQRLGREAHDSADGHVERLSAVVAAAAGARRDRSGQSAGRPAIAVPPGGRADSRQRAGRERPAGEQARRRHRAAVSAGRSTTRR